MKLRQFEYVHEVVHRGLSVSNAASALHTSQPGVSHQIRALEEELGVDIFVRDKSRLVSLTPNGGLIVDHVKAILTSVRSIRQIAESAARKGDAQLTVVCTHTQARYILPDVLSRFSAAQPDVRLSVQHRAVGDVLDAFLEEGDIALSPVWVPLPPDVVMIEFKRQSRMVIVPAGHPLEGRDDATLQDIVKYPLIMYEQSVPTRAAYMAIFEKAGLVPNVALNVINSDVMKACVESGLGIAIVPEYVFAPERDVRLRALRIGHLLPPAFSWIALKRSRPLTPAMRQLVALLAPSLTPAKLQSMMRTEGDGAPDS